MKVKKLLNQNAVLIDDDGQEKVAIGKGIGFNKNFCKRSRADVCHGARLPDEIAKSAKSN